MRGGLLVTDPSTIENDINTLQLIVNTVISSDPVNLDVLKELRKDYFLLKEDIKDHHRLYWSCHPQAKMRFEYLAEWDPDNLMSGTYKSLPLGHAIVKQEDGLNEFTMYLQTALKHHPQHLGMFFQKG